MWVVAENSIISSLERIERTLLVFNLGAIYSVGLPLSLWFLSLISVNYLVFGRIQASFRSTSQIHAGLLTFHIHWLYLSALSWLLCKSPLHTIDMHCLERQAWRSSGNSQIVDDVVVFWQRIAARLCVSAVSFILDINIAWVWLWLLPVQKKWFARLLVRLWQYMQNKVVFQRTVYVSYIYGTDIC